MLCIDIFMVDSHMAVWRGSRKIAASFKLDLANYMQKSADIRHKINHKINQEFVLLLISLYRQNYFMYYSQQSFLDSLITFVRNRYLKGILPGSIAQSVARLTADPEVA